MLFNSCITTIVNNYALMSNLWHVTHYEGFNIIDQFERWGVNLHIDEHLNTNSKE